MNSTPRHSSRVHRINPETIEHYIKILPNFGFLRETHQLSRKPATSKESEE